MKLTDKFKKSEIEWRVQQSGIGKNGAWAMILPYITSRAIMDRLDDVAGTANWKDSYEQFNNGLMCTIFIRLTIDKEGTKEWIGKCDGAPETKIESFKGGMSDAFKRAAVKWGMGRYLYAMKGPFFVSMNPDKNGEYNGQVKSKDGKTTYYTWDAPNIEGIYASE